MNDWRGAKNAVDVVGTVERPELQLAQTRESETGAQMTGGSPPPPNSRSHAPWNRGQYRGRRGGPWGFPRRGVRSPQNNHQRFRSNHRNGPQQQPGRVNFQSRHNRHWQPRNSPRSPHRQNDGNWQRSQYKSYHGPSQQPPNGQRRLSGSPPMSKQGHGHQGNQSHSGRDRRDMPPPNSAKRRSYTPPRGFSLPSDPSRSGPPPLSSHLHPSRSRLPAPIPQRPNEKHHSGRNQQGGGRGPRLQASIPQRPSGNHYSSGNQQSGGRMFNSSRMQQKSDNSGNVPSVFSRMAPVFASQQPPRHMSRSMHRALSPQRAALKTSPPVNPNMRGRTGPSPNKALSERKSVPSGSFRKPVSAKPPVTRAAGKEEAEKTNLPKTSPATTTIRNAPEEVALPRSAPVRRIPEAGLEKAIPPKNASGKNASGVDLEKAVSQKRTLAKGISESAAETFKLSTKSAEAPEKRSPHTTSQKEKGSPRASPSRTPPSHTFSSPDPAKSVRKSPPPDPTKSVRRFPLRGPEKSVLWSPLPEPEKPVRRSPLPEPEKLARRSPLPEPEKPARRSPLPEPEKPVRRCPLPEVAKPVNRSPLPDTARPVRRSPLASLPLTSATLIQGNAQLNSSPLPSLRSSPAPKLPLSKPYVPPLAGDMSTTAARSPKSKVSPVPRAMPPVPKASSLVPVESSPAPEASSPTPRASSPVRKSRSPSPSLSAPVVALPTPELLAAIGDVDAAMLALRRKIACKKARILGVSNEEGLPPKNADDKENGHSESPNALPNGLPVNVNTEVKKKMAEALTRSLGEANEAEYGNVDYVSPVHSRLARILNSNRAKARAAADVFRPLCHDPEQGLNSAPLAQTPVCSVMGDNVVTKVRDVIQNRRLEDVRRRRALAKEYVGMKHAWRRRLKSVRDKRSKEKREASRDRDRYLLVHTRGASALLTCKTSSGRTSTKVLPGVTPGGSLNNMAEIDSMLADIEHAGGTPGSHHIWGKTLADIPVQDPNHVPFDCGNLLIDDPIAELHAARCVSPWTREEKLIFLDKYLLYQKNFRKISTFLEHKNTMDCVRFYFDHKLLYDLKQLLRDSSSMKRKGTREMHLLNLVGLPQTRRSMHIYGIDANGTVGSPAPDSEALIQLGTSSMKHGIGSADKPKPHAESDSAHGDALTNRELSGTDMHKSENTAIDLSQAERDAFCEALAVHGSNWQAISEAYNFFDKDSARLEEYFHRNKQRFNFLAHIEKHEKKPTAGTDPISDNEEPVPGLTSRSAGKSGAIAKSTSGGLTERDDPQSGMSSSTWKGSGSSSTPVEPVRSSQKLSIIEASGTVRQGSGLEASEKPTKPKATWTAEEMEEFEHHFRSVGKDFKKIASLMDKKTPEQVKGYWKVTMRQEREKSSKKKHRMRMNSDQASPQHSRDGVARHGTAFGGRKTPKESERDSRKRDADEARLADQRGGHEKRERISDVSGKAGRGQDRMSAEEHGEKSNAGRRDGLAGSQQHTGAGPENRKYVSESGRPPLRSKSAVVSRAEGDRNSPNASPSDRRERDREKSPRN